MSIVPYAEESNYARQLKNNNFKIYYDHVSESVVIEINGQKISIADTYTKYESDNRFAAKEHTHDFAFNINTFLAAILSNDLKIYNMVTKVEDDIKTYPQLTKILASNTISTRDDLASLKSTDEDLYREINEIVSCTCNHEQMKKDREKLNEIYRRTHNIDYAEDTKLTSLHSNLIVHGKTVSRDIPLAGSFLKFNYVDDSDPFNPKYKTTTLADDLPIDPEKPIWGTYTMPACLTLNGTINGIHTDDIITVDKLPDTTSQFITEKGFPYYYVKNSDVVHGRYDGDISYLGVTLPSNVITSLSAIHDLTEVFEVKIRDNKIIDGETLSVIRSVYIYYNGSQFLCPLLERNTETGRYTILDRFEVIPTILATYISPYDMYINGNLSFVYLLCDDALEAKQNTVKCDIIESRNSFKLHESDVIYLYQPTRATESVIGCGDCWMLEWVIPENVTINDHQPFVFKEYAFGNTWSLTFNKDGQSQLWEGYNIQNRWYADVINKYSANDVYITFYVAHNDEMKKWMDARGFPIDQATDNYAEGFAGHLKWYFEYHDGHREEINMSIVTYYAPEKWLSDGYNRKNLNIKRAYDSKINLLVGVVDCVGVFTEISFYVNPHSTMVKVRNRFETINKINARYENKTYGDKTRNIRLYMRKDFVNKNSENSWDGKQNPFQYIMDCKFYEVFPNPSACSTLYTDFNITSSRIITADNITTMAANLNIVSNTQEVLTNDVDLVKNSLAKLSESFDLYKEKQDWYQKMGLALTLFAGVELTFMKIASTLPGLKLAGNGISSLGSLTFTNARGDLTGFTILPEADGLPLWDLDTGRLDGRSALKINRTSRPFSDERVMSELATKRVIEAAFQNLGINDFVLKKELSVLVEPLISKIDLSQYMSKEEMLSYIPHKLEVGRYTISEDGTDMAIRFEDNVVISVFENNLLVDNLKKQDDTPYITLKDLPEISTLALKSELPNLLPYALRNEIPDTHKYLSHHLPFNIRTTVLDYLSIDAEAFALKNGKIVVRTQVDNRIDCKCEISFTDGVMAYDVIGDIVDGEYLVNFNQNTTSKDILNIYFIVNNQNVGVHTVIENIDFTKPTIALTVDDTTDVGSVVSVKAMKSELSTYALKSEIPNIDPHELSIKHPAYTDSKLRIYGGSGGYYLQIDNTPEYIRFDLDGQITIPQNASIWQLFGNRFVTTADLTSYALKTEIPSIPDLSTCMHTGYKPFEISPLHMKGVMYEGQADLNCINNGVITIHVEDDAKTFDVTCSISFLDGNVSVVDWLGSEFYDNEIYIKRNENENGKDELSVGIYKDENYEDLNYTIIENKNYDDSTSIEHYLKKTELPVLIYKPFGGTLTTSETEKIFAFTNKPKNGILRFHVEADNNTSKCDMIVAFKNGESTNRVEGTYYDATATISYNWSSNRVIARYRHHMDQSYINSFELVENINYDETRKVVDNVDNISDEDALVSVKAVKTKITDLENTIRIMQEQIASLLPK